MLQYFDKDFFKFLISFVAIVIISLVFMAVLKEYQSGSRLKPAPSANIAVPKP